MTDGTDAAAAALQAGRRGCNRGSGIGRAPNQNLVPVQGNAAALTACLGTGIPDLADGAYDCTRDDVEGHVENGQHLYIDWHDRGGDEIRHISLDFTPSANTRIRRK